MSNLTNLSCFKPENPTTSIVDAGEIVMQHITSLSPTLITLRVTISFGFKELIYCSCSEGLPKPKRKRQNLLLMNH